MLAYFDSITQGLVPCQVVAMGNDELHGLWIRVRFTASRGPWRRGEVTTWTGRSIVPRHAVKRRKYSSTILPYSWRELAAAAGMAIAS